VGEEPLLVAEDGIEKVLRAALDRRGLVVGVDEGKSAMVEARPALAVGVFEEARRRGGVRMGEGCAGEGVEGRDAGAR